MADSTIRIETDHPVVFRTKRPFSVETTRKVSMKTEGDIVTVAIQGVLASPSDTVSSSELPSPDAAPRPGRKRPRCGQIMKHAGEPCARVQGHKGIHMTSAQVERKQTYNNIWKRERYQTDPAFADKVKAAVRTYEPKETPDAE